MLLKEVLSAADRQEFLRVPTLMNKGNDQYIRPLDKDIEDVFDPQKNKAFRFGKAIRWILYNEKNELIGRIAAFTNKKYKNKGDEFPVGGMGFFDCIHNQEAAEILLQSAAQWLSNEGMEAMDGPINFGERDRWWGLLIEGFQSPLYCMNYNPPYYKELLEGFGFELFFNQICFGFNPYHSLSDKVKSRYQEWSTNPAFRVEQLQKNKIERFAKDFATVYNKAWAGHGGLKEMKREQAVALFRKMKPVMDPNILWFAYHHEEPIAIFINLPDLNQWFKHLEGKFDLWHQLKFLWIRYTKNCTKFTGLVFGVIPEFQGKGIDSFLIGSAHQHLQQLPYIDYEMQWIGDFNPKMMNVAEQLGDTFRTRTLATYRYIFDRTIPFKRHPQI